MQTYIGMWETHRSISWTALVSPGMIASQEAALIGMDRHYPTCKRCRRKIKNAWLVYRKKSLNKKWRIEEAQLKEALGFATYEEDEQRTDQARLAELQSRIAAAAELEAALYSAIGRIQYAQTFSDMDVREHKMQGLQMEIDRLKDAAGSEQERMGNLSDSGSDPKTYKPYVPTRPYSLPDNYGKVPSGLSPQDQWNWYMNKYSRDTNPRKGCRPHSPVCIRLDVRDAVRLA